MIAKNTSVYINGMGIIAPQVTASDKPFLQDIITYDTNVLTCVTTDFKAYINPIQLRRLSRMLRIGLTASIMCLRDAGLQTPDGIITATGYGFLEETEKFLREVLERHENQLTPTHFAQGTYNALAGLIGLSTGCKGYNSTYVSKGFALENAINDATLQLESSSASSFLVGSFDEAENVLRSIGTREHYFKAEHIKNTELFDSHTPGTLQGEGSAFFLLSRDKAPSTWCSLVDLRVTFKPTDEIALALSLQEFLEANNISVDKIDGVISGTSGDVVKDQFTTYLEKTMLYKIPAFRFKHLCGEYCTAVSFGLWLGASIIKKQTVPNIISPGITYSPSGKIKTLLLINHFLGRNYSFVLLSAV